YTDSNIDLRVSDNPIVEQFFAYGANFTGGVYVAAGVISGAGNLGAEIITTPGTGGGPHVKIFTDSNNNGMAPHNALLDQCFPDPVSFTGGVRVAAGDTDNSGNLVEVITAPGPGGGALVQIQDDTADAGELLSDNAPSDSFFAYPTTYLGGSFVAFGKV